MKKIIFIISILVTCCQYFTDYNTFVIKLHTLPEHWVNSFPEIKYLVVYPDHEENITEKYYPINTETIKIEYEKMKIMPVTVYAVTDCCILPPAGAVYPYSMTDSGILECSWESGAAAEIFVTLISGGMNIESFNTERLYNEILSRIPDDPLKINKQNIIDSVLSGSFRVTDIKTLDEKALEIKLDTGIWFTESPYSELYAITEPCEKTIPLTYGFHVLYNSCSKDYYNIYIDENNTVIENHPEKATFP